MTNLSEMTNEDLLRAYWKNCRKAPHAFDDKLDNDLYEELLRRLSAVPSGEPPQPRCPKCGSNDLALVKMRFVQVRCNSCATTWFRMESVADFAQFFGPSAPQPQPNKWPDLVYGDKESWCGKYTRNGEANIGGNINSWYATAVFWRNRAEGILNPGELAPSGGAGQEPSNRYWDIFTADDGGRLLRLCWRKNDAGNFMAMEVAEFCTWNNAAEQKEAEDFALKVLNAAEKDHDWLRKRADGEDKHFLSEPEGRASAAEPGRCCDNGYFGDDHECQKSNPESVVSASPTLARNVAIYGSERGGWPCQVCGYGHVANTDCPAVQPVAANPPKVEEVAKQIAMECYDSMVLSPAQEIKIKDIAAAILGPFFTQVSQPPTEPDPWKRVAQQWEQIGKLQAELRSHVEKIRNQKAEIKRLQELHAKPCDYQRGLNDACSVIKGGQNIAAIGKLTKKHYEPAAPVTPVSGKQRVKGFDWQCDNCRFRDDPTIPGKPTICPKCGWNKWSAVSATPVSGNGTEPPDEVQTITQEKYRALNRLHETMAIAERLRERAEKAEAELASLPARWTEDSSLETWFPLTAEELRHTKSELEQAKASNWANRRRADAAEGQLERAGAASHNGQRWPNLRETELLIKLRAADEMARIADDWVERGQIDSRSALADARLNYGKPYTYEFSQPLPAPPSEGTKKGEIQK